MLPDVFRSDLNQSLFENTLNRFLSKSETIPVAGIIGKSNLSAIIKRQLQEPTPHRQAFQLQPILYNKIGTVEHISSWEDLLNELKRLGVDSNRFNSWGKVVNFNWAPPIDIDKLLNYTDYFWFDSDNPTSLPQYITIRNKCNIAEAKVNYFTKLINQNGGTFEIKNVAPSTNSVIVKGDVSSFMTTDLVIFIKNSPNVDLNNSFHTIVSSSYDGNTDKTTIVIDTPFVNTLSGGVISLEELLNGLIAGKQCQCDGTIGWDVQLWDDNQVGNVLWSDQLLSTITFALESQWVTANGSPSLYDLWFDTTSNSLKQYNGTSWIIVQNNFSLIVDEIRGDALWDFSSGCGTFSTIGTSADQWISQNKWVHRNDIINFSSAKQAQIPIIEYFSNLELNEWTCVEYNWKYAVSQFETFNTTDAKPNRLELSPIDWYDIDLITVK